MNSKLLAVLSATVVTLSQATLELHAKTFAGFECTDDCSGHIAGYRWAERHGISSILDCAGNSESFAEGCEAFVEGLLPIINGNDGDEDEDDDPPV